MTGQQYGCLHRKDFGLEVRVKFEILDLTIFELFRRKTFNGKRRETCFFCDFVMDDGK